MHIIVVGMNHRTAPVEVREQVSVPEAALPAVLAEIRESRTVLESVLLSTCNRTELYAVASSSRGGEEFLRRFFAVRLNQADGSVEPFLYVHRGEAAVTHLMRVACGLDSMVIGETQILGQVRSAYQAAVQAGNTGALLNQLFRMAIALGKQVQTEVGLSQNAVSVSYAAVQLVKKIFGELAGRTVLVIGAGKMGRLAVQHIQANGARRIRIANRTYERALELARACGGEAVPWEQLDAELAAADVVFSSTGAGSYVVSEADVERAVRRRVSPLVLIDIAVPRDIDPRAGRHEGVYLYDIDDLRDVVAANLEERRRKAECVERMVRDALYRYSEWLAEQEVVPLIRAIRAKGVQIQAAVMDSLIRKLPELTERERQLIQKHTMSIVNQLLREPVQNMKEMAIASGGGAGHVQVFARLFGITPEMMATETGLGVLEPDPNRLQAGVSQAEQMSWKERVLGWGHDTAEDDGEHPVLHPVLR
ncbi:MAG: glutamyl-tRNA reductase [Alicyclobacillaceae bacterium]|nr:glutamyl-tRNA reductase [Alicyclobacillaceae bacterium]